MKRATSTTAPDPVFWRGKRVLVTGHTGFKGAWLSLWLQRLGAEVTGLALPAPTEPNLFELSGLAKAMNSHMVDIRDLAKVAQVVRTVQPEVVLHLAAQSLVRASYRDPITNWTTNLMGTVNLLEALRQHPGTRVAVLVTTDKVYRNREWCHPYRETDELGGHDPYSASKAACEIAIASYRDAFLAQRHTSVSSARAGNVIGGGDWAAERLFPDAVRAWQSQASLSIRRPLATRPWQHVLEPLAGYLCLAQAMWHNPSLTGAWNFGPDANDCATVQDVIQTAQAAWGPCEVSFGLDEGGPHEAGWLALDTARVRAELGVTPRWDLQEAVQRTIHWYRAQDQGRSAKQLCDEDFAAWEAAQ